MRDFVAVIAALIAFSAAVVSSVLTYRGQRQQYFTELRRWSDEACDTLSEAVHACDLDPSKMPGDGFFNLRHSLSHRVSSQIDRGRYFFPNLQKRQHGRKKPGSFQGIRQPALDCLLIAYRAIRGLDYLSKEKNIPKREALVEAKREFISIIQIYLDPRHRRVQFRKLVAWKGSIQGEDRWVSKSHLDE